MYCRLFSYIVLLFSVCSYSAGRAEPTARFSGEITEDSHVRLMWKVTSWTSELEGLSVQRKLKPDASWDNIGPQVIYPGYHERDWTEYGVSADEVSHVVSTLEGFTKGGLNPLPARQAIERLQEHGSSPVGTQLSFNRDYANALVGGFGLIDSDTGGQRYIYGLFPVFSGQQISETPISTFSAVNYAELSKKAAVDLRAAYQNGQCRISWSLPASVYESVGVIGYKIYVKPGIKESFRPLFEKPMWRGEENEAEGKIAFEYNDSVSPAAKGVRFYAIEAHTAFGDTLPRKTVVCEVFPKVKPPNSLKHDRLQNGAYELSWVMPESNLEVDGLSVDVERIIIEDFDSLSEFEKLSGEVTSRPYETVASGIPIETNVWVDELRVAESTQVSYRVRIKNSTGETLATSQAELSSIQPNLLLPPVEGLRMVLKPSPRESGAIVRLEWGYPAEKDSLVKYFYVSGGESPEQLVRFASDHITDKFYERHVSGKGKEHYYQVVPVAKNGLHGEPRMVECYLPKTRLDPFPKESGIKYLPELNEPVSTIGWEYGDRTDLTGFRIRHLETKEIIADTDQIGPNDSEWVWRDEALQEKRRIPVEIQAVGVFDYITSFSKVAYLNTMHYGRNYSLPEAEIHQVKVYEEDGEKTIALEWEPWDEEAFKDVSLIGIGPAKADQYSSVPLYRLGWQHYRVSENGKLVVEIPDYLELSGEVPMRMVPLYDDDQGRPTIKGTFTEFMVNLDQAQNRPSVNSDHTAKAED